MSPRENDLKTAASPAEAEKTESGFDAFDPENLMIISVNDDSKKIRQILSNETSMKIVDILKKENLSAGELSEKLSMPLPTVKYNLDILVENGLVRIKSVRYSEKGRRVKIYEAPEKVIVFAPETISRISLVTLLQKYAAAFVFSVFGALGFSAVRRHFTTMPEAVDPYNTRSVDMSARLVSGETDIVYVNESAADAAGATADAVSAGLCDIVSETIRSLLSSDWFWFLSGAVFVLLIFLLYDLPKRRKQNK